MSRTKGKGQEIHLLTNKVNTACYFKTHNKISNKTIVIITIIVVIIYYYYQYYYLLPNSGTCLESLLY